MRPPAGPVRARVAPPRQVAHLRDGSTPQISPADVWRSSPGQAARAVAHFQHMRSQLDAEQVNHVPLPVEQHHKMPGEAAYHAVTNANGDRSGSSLVHSVSSMPGSIPPGTWVCATAWGRIAAGLARG